MSMFSSPEEHAANPPASWSVVRVGRRYSLQTKDGGVLSSYERKRDAEEEKESGRSVNLYNKEARWYAGEQVDNWKPYVPAWVAMYPEGRFLYFEGDDPEGFASKIRKERGFDPSADPRWGTGTEPSHTGGDITDPFGRLYGFHCPQEHLAAINGGRFPIGS